MLIFLRQFGIETGRNDTFFRQKIPLESGNSLKISQDFPMVSQKCSLTKKVTSIFLIILRSKNAMKPEN